MKTLAAALVVLIASAAGTPASAVTITVQYPHWMERIFEAATEEFERRNPDVEVEFLAPTQSYEESAQKVLRAAASGSLPDVSNQGLNLIDAVAERGVHVPLAPLVAKLPDAVAQGFTPDMLEMGTTPSGLAALPLAYSTPVAYYNMDIVARAGWGDRPLPRTWDELMELADAVGRLPSAPNPFFINYDEGGSFLYQALLFSHGGAMAGPDGFAFDDETGRRVFAMMPDLVAKRGMPTYSQDQAQQDFYAGNLGVLLYSTSFLTRYEEQVGGRFPLAVAPFPLGVPEGRVPAGGNANMVFASDPDRQDAAWRYVSFLSGPLGSAIVVRNSGYLPPNRRAAEEPDLLGRFYEENPDFRAAAAQIPIITKWYSFPGPNGIRANDAFRSAVTAATLGQGEPDGILRDVRAEVERLTR
ncbi:extracellular solute-binding protein [Arenibaculum sp.]|uniref:extracellular solute-binding protein n=1 Tax=Arenibaculum sp. TaxID=2865862 RepID=UPI002E159C6A|nr:extracellular solute-binding protein [Arenibaculum sp.]